MRQRSRIFPFTIVSVPLRMTRGAKPSDVQRSQIIIVMRVDIVLVSALAARLPEQLSTSYGIIYHDVCPVFVGIFFSIFFNVFRTLSVAPFPVVLSHPLDIFIPVLRRVLSSTTLTFVQMPVSHSIVLIELCQGLFFATLETSLFHRIPLRLASRGR